MAHVAFLLKTQSLGLELLPETFDVKHSNAPRTFGAQATLLVNLADQRAKKSSFAVRSIYADKSFLKSKILGRSHFRKKFEATTVGRKSDFLIIRTLAA